jgi:RNA polymerase sigma factor (sigma-70 family)
MLLSAEKERDLARRYRQGDEKAGHQLALAYLPLVTRLAVKYALKYRFSLEDLIPEGWIGLMKAIPGYDPDQGWRLGTYAAKWIEAEIRDYTVRESAFRRVMVESLNEPAGGEETGLEKIDLQADEADDQESALIAAQERRLRKEFLESALDRLPGPERQIVVERHLREEATPLKDLGARFGRSGESARQMELKALKALKGMAAREAA